MSFSKAHLQYQKVILGTYTILFCILYLRPCGVKTFLWDVASSVSTKNSYLNRFPIKCFPAFLTSPARSCTLAKSYSRDLLLTFYSSREMSVIPMKTDRKCSAFKLSQTDFVCVFVCCFEWVCLCRIPNLPEY